MARPLLGLLTATVLVSSALPVAAADAPTRSVVVTDAAGDVLTMTPEPADAPGQVDITSLSVWVVEGSGVVVRLETAAPIVGTPLESDMETSFRISFDTNSDRLEDYDISIAPASGFDSSGPVAWRARLSDAAGSLVVPLGAVDTSDGSLTIDVPLPALGTTLQRVRAESSAWSIAGQRGDGEGARFWQDETPDTFGRWATLRDAEVGDRAPIPLGDAAVPRLVARGVSAAIATDAADGDLDEVRARLLELLADRPPTADVLLDVLQATDLGFRLCEAELVAGIHGFDRPAHVDETLLFNSACATSFAALFLAYAHTGDEDFHELLARFVGITAPRLEPGARENYRAALTAIPDLLQTMHEPLFEPAQ